MTGTIALIGGGAFTDPLGALDRELLAVSGASNVAVLPTADAFEHPERLLAAAAEWFSGLGAQVTPVPVLTRVDALDDRHVAAVATSRFVYLVGDSPLHLRSVLKDTPLFDALGEVLAAGGVVAASGASADALCDPMVDPRGGAFTIGLGLVRGLALATEAETWSPERLKRTVALATGFALAELPSGSAVVRSAAGWRTYGAAAVHGELPA
jgi:cyanophycinase